MHAVTLAIRIQIHTAHRHMNRVIFADVCNEARCCRLHANVWANGYVVCVGVGVFDWEKIDRFIEHKTKRVRIQRIQYFRDDLQFG